MTRLAAEMRGHVLDAWHADRLARALTIAATVPLVGLTLMDVASVVTR